MDQRRLMNPLSDWVLRKACLGALNRLVGATNANKPPTLPGTESPRKVEFEVFWALGREAENESESSAVERDGEDTGGALGGSGPSGPRLGPALCPSVPAQPPPNGVFLQQEPTCRPGGDVRRVAEHDDGHALSGGDLQSRLHLQGGSAQVSFFLRSLIPTSISSSWCPSRCVAVWEPLWFENGMPVPCPCRASSDSSPSSPVSSASSSESEEGSGEEPPTEESSLPSVRPSALSLSPSTTAAIRRLRRHARLTRISR